MSSRKIQPSAAIQDYRRLELKQATHLVGRREITTLGYPWLGAFGDEPVRGSQFSTSTRPLRGKGLDVKKGQQRISLLHRRDKPPQDGVRRISKKGTALDAPEKRDGSSDSGRGRLDLEDGGSRSAIY